MSDWAHIRDEEESDAIQEAREIAQEQLIRLSEAHVSVCDELKKYKKAYGELP